MQTTKGFRLICAALLVSGFFYGCGNSKKSDTIPTTATIFYSHSVIFKNQSTYTMGYNGFGQLGDGSLTNRPAATKIGGLGPMFKGVIGAEHTMVLGSDGSVHTWGYNLYGQLGDPAVPKDPPQTAFSDVPVKVPSLQGVTDIAAGAFHSLAVAGGVIKSWGYNRYGQLGNGKLADADSPVDVTTDRDGLPIPPAAKVAAGATHSVALCSDGSLYTWGEGAAGQLGFGNFSNYTTPRKVTSIPQNGGKLVKIAALARATVALEEVTDNSGITRQTLWGWGYNGRGELGIDPATKEFSNEPVPIFDVQNVTGTTPVIKQIATGLNHILLLLGQRDSLPGDYSSWQVQGIGFNFYGQLGNGKLKSPLGNDTSMSSFELVQTLMPPGPMTGVSEIAAFGYHSFALVNGVWYGWGNNGLGQLGNPIATTTVGYFELPTPVQGL